MQFHSTDPRVKDWPMMQSPLPTLALCIFYAYFCKSLAPRWMEHRQPFGLRRTLIIYNLFQTVFSAWIFYEVSFDPLIVKKFPFNDDSLHCSIFKADGCEITATGVNLWITHRRVFGWRKRAGGTTSRSSPSSSILCSFC